MDFAEMVKRQNVTNKKTFKSDVKQWERALSVKTVDVEKRQIRVLASSPDLDRDNERVLPQAFKNRLSIYQANPVILAAHQHRIDDGSPPVVGKAASIWIDNTGLWCIIEFAKTPLAEEYWLLYSGGFMRAVSIGFAPLAWNDTNENGKGVRVFTEVELFEISLVAVPANRAALSKSQQQKFDWVQDKKILADIKNQNPNFKEDCNEFAAMLLSGESDGEFCGEFTETDTAVSDEQPDNNRFELAKMIHPQGDYEENEFIRLVTRQ